MSFLRRRDCLVGSLAFAIPAARAQSSTEITIGAASGSLAASSLRLAKEIGLFEKRRLDPKFIVMDSSTAAITALISGSLNIVYAGVPELVVARSRGQKVVAVANLYSGFATSLVLAKSVVDKLGVDPTAPPEARLRALDGLVIASTSGTAIGTVAFRSAAQAAGGTIRFTYLTQPAMPAALESGAIQGFTSSTPYWGIPIEAKSGVLWLSGPKGDLQPQYTPKNTLQLQMMRDFAEANGEIRKVLISIRDEFSTAIVQRPGEIKAAISKLFPGLSPTTIDLLFASESLGWRAKPLSADDMRHEIALLRSTGVQLPDMDPAGMIWPS